MAATCRASYSFFLVLGWASRTCFGLGTYGFDIHHRFSDPVKAILGSDELPEKGGAEYYAAMAHRDRSIRGRHLSTCREVRELDHESVQYEIELQMLKVIKSILDGNGFTFQVPSRAAANQLYIPELDRIVLKDKTSLRPYTNVSTVRKATITSRVLQLIHQLCLKDIHVTKRDLFYTDVKLFQDQNQSDSVLDDAACMVGCTRSSLNVIASEKGVVVGRLIFSDNGDMIDCTRKGQYTKWRWRKEGKSICRVRGHQPKEEKDKKRDDGVCPARFHQRRKQKSRKQKRKEKKVVVPCTSKTKKK